MVVTPSRLHAVRYLLEFRRQIREKGYTDINVQVAFSGEVWDGDDEPYTEEKLNRDKDGKSIYRSNLLLDEESSAGGVQRGRLSNLNRCGKVSDGI